MKKIVLLLQGLCLVSNLTNTMELNPYTYKKADAQDTSSIVNLINTQAIYDRTKIVVLPKTFRESDTEKNIKLGKLFVAHNSTNSALVAYKKLYLPDENECTKIMQDEIRAIGPQSHLVDSYYFDNNNKKHILNTNINFDLNKSVVIYNGGDFTACSDRGKGINTRLSQYAFDQIEKEVIAQVKTKNALQLLLIYGLTKSNAGEIDSNDHDRTPGIVRLFKSFAQKIQSHFFPLNTSELRIDHQRYTAYMPTFKLDSEECIPLDDDQAIEGYGNVLSCQLKQEQK